PLRVGSVCGGRMGTKPRRRSRPSVPMSLSRRTFLGAVSAGAVLVSASVLGALRSARVVARRLGPPVVDDAATGELSAHHLRTLLAAAAAVAGAPIRQEHYAAFFPWRAAHPPRHPRRYEPLC